MRSDVTQNGFTTTVNLSDETTALSVKLMQHEAESLVVDLLMSLAQVDSFKWEGIFNEARNTAA